MFTQMPNSEASHSRSNQMFSHTFNQTYRRGEPESGEPDLPLEAVIFRNHDAVVVATLLAAVNGPPNAAMPFPQ